MATPRLSQAEKDRRAFERDRKRREEPLVKRGDDGLLRTIRCVRSLPVARRRQTLDEFRGSWVVMTVRPVRNESVTIDVIGRVLHVAQVVGNQTPDAVVLGGQRTTSGRPARPAVYSTALIVGLREIAAAEERQAG